ncbi:MAG TPA: TldD/PmbA family protein [Dissulfurispiraceae bacterium]|nr:TldD/PmbA family protein [Dissulfurispiraceae bacterium]
MIREFGRKLVDAALSRGADQAEAYVRRERGLGVEVKGQKVESLEASTTMGYSIRLIRDGRLGFSFSTNPAEIMRVIESALEASRYTEPDAFNGLPAKAEPSAVATFDNETASISESAAVELTMLLERSAFSEDRRIAKIRKAAGHFGSSDTAIVNSLGISVEYPSTFVSAQIMAVAEEGSESQAGWDYEGSRFLRDVSFERVGKNAARRAISILGAEKTTPARGFVLLDSSVAYEFLSILSASLSAEAVQKGKSMLAQRKGDVVMSPLVNVVDNGLMVGKTGSRPVDAEGVPTTNKTLIERGVLKGFLFNTYCARKGGGVSTGNAVRSGHAGLPVVGPTNFFIEPAEMLDAVPFDSLVAAVDSGIYVIETMGMHTANPISGDFSVGASGLRIEGGRIGRPFKEAIISGNILDLFRNIRLVGDDLKFYGSIGSPTLLIEGIDISG